MSTFDRSLWKTTRRVAEAYHLAHRAPRSFGLPESTWRDALANCTYLAKAQNHGWRHAAALECRRLGYELERLITYLQELQRTVVAETCEAIPSVSDLYQELSATRDEFGEVTIDGSELCVATDCVMLEGIRLGPFEIRLNLHELASSAPFRVVALEPHPASSCEETTHPHVNHEQLCTGDGRPAIAAALREGRLHDFFTVVDRILRTYAAGAAYVELDRWYGVTCHDCGGIHDSDDSSACQRCDESLCGDCYICCESCETSYCSRCIDRCASCDDLTCSDCLNDCPACKRHLCKSCFDEEWCTDCLEESTHDENQETTSENPAAASV